MRIGLIGLALAAGLVWISSRHPIDARQDPNPGTPPGQSLVVPKFQDDALRGLVTTLDQTLDRRVAAQEWAADAAPALAAFTRSIQEGQLSPVQEDSVVRHLENVANVHQSDRAPIDGAVRTIETLTVGKVAPDIVGRDLDGAPMTLSAYRSKVIVLTFSGEWCGICRSQYPYERLLLELYAKWPFAILGVNSDRDAIEAKAAYLSHGLTFPSWFDGDPSGDPRGPIATAWNVNGWPSTYVIDGRGVIRFVNLQQEDLLKGVRQLLTEEVERASHKASGDRHQ